MAWQLIKRVQLELLVTFCASKGYLDKHNITVYLVWETKVLLISIRDTKVPLSLEMVCSWQTWGISGLRFI